MYFCFCVSFPCRWCSNKCALFRIVYIQGSYYQLIWYSVDVSVTIPTSHHTGTCSTTVIQCVKKNNFKSCLVAGLVCYDICSLT